jgi:hypothetical protein
MNFGYGKRENMRYERKTFGQLKPGEHFWGNRDLCGDMDAEKVKASDGIATYADGIPGAKILYSDNRKVWVASCSVLPKWIVLTIVTIMAIATISLVWWILYSFRKGL